MLFLATTQKVFGIISKDSMEPGNSNCKTFNNFKALNIVLASTKKVVIFFGKGKSLRVAPVIIPRVPSAPINRFFRS